MVSINPGVALGGAILGITPGAALEKKSVRDIAAGFAANKLGEWELLFIASCRSALSEHAWQIFLMIYFWFVNALRAFYDFSIGTKAPSQ